MGQGPEERRAKAPLGDGEGGCVEGSFLGATFLGRCPTVHSGALVSSVTAGNQSSHHVALKIMEGPVWILSQ